ncbi:hypothetical protein BB8028_0003g06770 [Beauveria bassiana]|uniref:Uncharacterized protein n=1 Tax=Beauveria bassiana TaxID=176275 RepID=A0A2S7Y798_BEABA|nr:hypothetical protein BB8028_0003g06770 [Beauveria bassiana]
MGQLSMTLATVVSRILGEYGIPLCIIGELALNYYNVPRVCYDLEVCVPKGSSIIAAARLCLSGFFQPFDTKEAINNYTEYKRGFPRLITTFLEGKQRSIIIFTANVYGLEPLEQKTLQSRGVDGSFSKEIADVPLEEIATLPLPRLAPFLAGLATKFILTQDDNAMIAVEQLVDGMDLDESWVDSQLADYPQAVRDMITGLINGKQCRIDYFSDNQVTCFIRDEAEAAHVRSIVGYI